MIRILNSFLLLLITSLLISCDSNRVYETNKNLAGKFWHKDSTQSFSFQIPNSKSGYNLYFNIRNTASYPFQNIYIQYELKDSLNKVLEEDLVNYQLFHSQTGEPFGMSGIGDIFDHQFKVLEDYEFPEMGKYTLHFSQMMRKDTLIEVVSVGARIEFFENEN